MHRLARVGLDQAQQHRVLDAGVDELRERDPEPLLVDLGRVHGDAARRDAADVGVMGHRRRVALERAVDEHRLDHVDVREMLAAAAVRVVRDVDVPGLRRRPELLEHVAHHGREGAELHGEGQALRDDAAVAVAERGRVVHRVANDRRVGAAHDHERHLVGGRREGVLDHLERDRIEACLRQRARPRCCRTGRVGPGSPGGRRRSSRPRR